MAKTGLRKTFSDAAALLDRLDSASQPKWFLCAGDHDVNPKVWSADSTDRSNEEYFRSLYEKINPHILHNLFYSFDVKGYHFVALYALEHLCTDPRWGNVFLSGISEAQYEWLKKDLSQADTARGVIVFIHQPLWFNWSSWLKVHELLARHNTRIVVAGHTHYDQNDHRLDGIQYRVVGATGGMIKNANAAAGGWWHVTRVTVSDAGDINWQLIPVGKHTKSDFSERPDMDRVQVLDYNLGNAALWLSQQKLRIKEGRLVDDTCRAGTSPRVTLGNFGNPIDRTVSMHILLKDTPKYRISSGAFSRGMCSVSASKSACTMSPNVNIAISNYALVNPTCDRFSTDYIYCLGYSPFWTGVIESVGAPSAGDRLTFSITMTYRSANGGQFTISKEAQTPVEACP
jgi:hypothetical protein